MRNLKILMFLFIAALFIQCDNNLVQEETFEKEARLETAEYIMENELSVRPDIFSFEGCYTFKDSAIKKAEYLTPFINYLGGDRKFDNSEYSILYDNVRNTTIKDTFIQNGVMVVSVLTIIGLFIMIINQGMLSNKMIAITFSVGLLLILLIQKIPIIPDNEMVEQETRRQYFICNTS